MTTNPAEASLAARLIDCGDRARAIPPGARAPSLDLAAAQRVQDLIRATRVARGERPVGYKIGFTNRTIWPVYGVDAPIWGPMYDTTVHRLAGVHASLDSSRFIEPRLEPEIVLCVARVPADDSLASLEAAIGWVAHGIEIVHSVYPGWRFTAAEGVAAQSLHGALFVGPTRAAAELAGEGGLAEALAGLRLTLERRDDGQWAPVDSGIGANVLDGPVQALAHLVRCLRAQGRTLAAGDIVTTGTITDAQPLAPGQAWRTRIDALDGLPGLEIDVA